MTINKMPTEEEIRALAENVRQTWSLGISSIERERASKSAYEMLLTIADHLSKSKPVAWMTVNARERWFQFKSLPDAYELSDGTHHLYTTPLADAEDARRLDWLNGQVEAYGFEDTHEGNIWSVEGPFSSLRDAIDAAMKGEGHED